ncbi:MAG TPA: MogA/MoaB family molybdenum cofactor biosynthesis protein [Thermoleophilaceae bacterium]|nr:MogA/MoaB family molybdenum cofactor biosynthesis protein [Thermoleophilaceae bacterium]
MARAAVVTISTRVSRGDAEDESGPALVELCEASGLDVVSEVLSDDREAIATALKRLADQEDVRFIFTTGGTGMTADDVTPEATRDVIDRDAPGYAETIRVESRAHTPLGILTRGVSGIRGRTLIVNFPGSPRAVRQSWPVVEPTLEHARDTLERS